MGKRKNLKQSRAAAIIAAILAFGMIVSSVTLYIGYISRDKNESSGNEWDLEAYRGQFVDTIENLESYVEEFGANVAVLNNLAENYQNLIVIQQMFFAESEVLKGYQQKLLGVYETLLELEPDEAQHRVQLLSACKIMDVDETVFLEHATILRDMLRANPAPPFSLSLMQLLREWEQEELLQEETAWVKAHLEEKLAGNAWDNYDRLYYAYLLGNFQDDKAGALAQLELILEEEDETSELYQMTERYHDQLLVEDETAPGED
ncbi:MAG: hypothetical protein AB1767_05405 [Bacillota bacterium]